jgi:hypothetical protein
MFQSYESKGRGRFSRKGKVGEGLEEVKQETIE